MPNLEFDAPMSFETPGGTFDVNVPDPSTGEIYVNRFESYAIVPAMRVTQDNISQADGSVLHTRYKTGLVVTMKVSYYVRTSGNDEGAPDVSPACGAQLRTMHEALIAALTSIQSLNGVQRYFWQPTGYGDERLLDDVQILAWPAPSYDLDGVEASVTFSVESPFPYAIDATEIDTDVPDGTTPTAIENAGNAAQSPVVRVHGPTSSFVVTNLDDPDEFGVPKQVVYDASRPGGVAIPSGHYAEIDFFRGTITLSGGAGTDVVAGLDPTQTDFFRMLPGSNDVTCSGATCTFLTNNAWA